MCLVLGLTNAADLIHEWELHVTATYLRQTCYHLSTTLPLLSAMLAFTNELNTVVEMEKKSRALATESQ